MSSLGNSLLAGMLATATWGCSSDDERLRTTPDVFLMPPEQGFQLKVDKFSVAPGEEVQDCYFFEVPYDHPVFVTKATIAQNEGSHHMNVFRVRSIDKLDGAPGEVVRGGECWKAMNWKDWPMVMNSQRADVEAWSLPEGVGLRFEPHEKLMLQTHWVNATTQQTPVGGEVYANFEIAPQGAELQELGTAFATNQSIRVCPGDVDHKFEASCKLAKRAPITIVAASGHFHSRGKSFTISGWDPTSGAGEQFYQSGSWNDPPFTRGLDVSVATGAGFSWTCDFSVPNDVCGDPADDCCFAFGGKVETQEHCNAFVYYYPRGATDLNCF